MILAAAMGSHQGRRSELTDDEMHFILVEIIKKSLDVDQLTEVVRTFVSEPNWWNILVPQDRTMSECRQALISRLNNSRDAPRPLQPLPPDEPSGAKRRRLSEQSNDSTRRAAMLPSLSSINTATVQESRDSQSYIMRGLNGAVGSHQSPEVASAPKPRRGRPPRQPKAASRLSTPREILPKPSHLAGPPSRSPSIPWPGVTSQDQAESTVPAPSGPHRRRSSWAQTAIATPWETNADSGQGALGSLARRGSLGASPTRPQTQHSASSHLGPSPRPPSVDRPRTQESLLEGHRRTSLSSASKEQELPEE